MPRRLHFLEAPFICCDFPNTRGGYGKPSDKDFGWNNQIQTRDSPGRYPAGKIVPTTAAFGRHTEGAESTRSVGESGGDEAR